MSRLLPAAALLFWTLCFAAAAAGLVRAEPAEAAFARLLAFSPISIASATDIAFVAGFCAMALAATFLFAMLLVAFGTAADREDSLRYAGGGVAGGLVLASIHLSVSLLAGEVGAIAPTVATYAALLLTGLFVPLVVGGLADAAEAEREEPDNVSGIESRASLAAFETALAALASGNRTMS